MADQTTTTLKTILQSSTVIFEETSFGESVRDFVESVLGDDTKVWAYVIIALFAVCMVLILSHFIVLFYKCFCKRRY